MKKVSTFLIIFTLLFMGCEKEEALFDQVIDQSKLAGNVVDDEMSVIDFEEFKAGEIVHRTAPEGCDGAVGIWGTNPNFPGQNAAMIFDSSYPTGEDYDLGTPNKVHGGPGVSSDDPDGHEASNDTPMGNVLILSEDMDASDPDDSYVDGSKYSLDFSGYGNGAVMLYGFDMLDLDEPGANNQTTVVKLYDASNALLLEKEIPFGPDNGVQFVDLEKTGGVAKMVLHLNNSGAIDNIRFKCMEDEEPPCDYEKTVLDFEEFKTGDIVYRMGDCACEGYVSVYGTNPNFDGQNAAMIFDSSNPTGEDYDLGTPNEMFAGPGISSEGDQPSNDTPLGNVLIISEDMDASDPDDSYVKGSKYMFDFTHFGIGTVTMYSFDMLDLDAPGAEGAVTVVKLYDKNDVVLLEKEIPYGPDNAKQLVDLEGTSGVAKMVLYLNNSGAIDNIMLKCDEEQKEERCETMFGKGDDDIATCFLDDGFNRWGWTNGPLSGGEYTFELYAGAGQCDTDKGEFVGYVHVDYNEEKGTLKVTYETMDDYYMKETHLYVGSDPYPKGNNGSATVAPGQYTELHEALENATMDMYEMEGLEGDIYIIAHGVVCTTKAKEDDDD